MAPIVRQWHSESDGRLPCCRGRLHQSVFGGHENGFTRWVGAHKRYLEWGSVLAWGLVMLVVNLSPKLVVVYGLLMLLSVLVVEFLSADASQGSK